MMGAALRAEREKRGLTVKDIEQETSIRAHYLEALEQGRYDDLPGEVYVKGFIRNYATFLRLDADKLVQEYREEIHGTDVAPIAPPPTTTSLVNERAPFSSGSDFHERVEKSHQKQIVATLVAAVAIVFIGSIYYFFGDDPAAVKPAQTAQQSTAQQPQPSAQSAQVQPRPAQPKPQPATPAPAQTSQAMAQQPAPPSTIGNTASAAAGQTEVTAKFTGRCWMQVIADGKNVYEGIVEANQTMRWTGKDMVVITAGNAGAIDVTYNGQRIGKLGKEGDVAEKKFSRGKVEDVK